MTATLIWMLECYGLQLVLVETSDEQLDQLDKLSREKIGRTVMVGRAARRCAETMDLFRKRTDTERAA